MILLLLAMPLVQSNSVGTLAERAGRYNGEARTTSAVQVCRTGPFRVRGHTA